MPRSFAAGLGLVVSSVLLLAGWPGSAQRVGAHADLVRAEPAVDAKLAQPPAQLILYFSQGIKQTGSFIQIEDATGTRLPLQVSFDATDLKVMRASVNGLTTGVYKVLWQTLSADDDDFHDGSYHLTVLNPDGSLPAGATAASDNGGGGSSDSIILVVVSIVVVVMVGGLAFYIRKLGREGR